MRLCPDSLWESLARTDETATFFQTPAWHRLAARHFGAECAPLLFDFPDGPACLPLLRDRRWGRARYFSPFGAYTALVCPRALTPRETAAIEAALARLNLHLASSPFTRNPVRAGRVITARTQVIDLAPGDAENPMRGWSPDPRRKVRMAREGGVRVRTAAVAAKDPAAAEADWKAYVSVYEKSLARWGERASSSYPASLFALLRALPEAAMTLWLAEAPDENAPEGRRVIAGYVAFSHNRHACIWHGASDPAFFRLGGVQLLYHDMTAHAAAAGSPVFDLLGSGGNPSLEAFKASLGARTVEYASSLNRTGLIGALADWRDGWSARR